MQASQCSWVFMSVLIETYWVQNQNGCHKLKWKQEVIGLTGSYWSFGGWHCGIRALGRIYRCCSSNRFLSSSYTGTSTIVVSITIVIIAVTECSRMLKNKSKYQKNLKLFWQSFITFSSVPSTQLLSSLIGQHMRWVTLRPSLSAFKLIPCIIHSKNSFYVILMLNTYK